jgi:cephalosporin hydroxylase
MRQASALPDRFGDPQRTSPLGLARLASSSSSCSTVSHLEKLETISNHREFSGFLRPKIAIEIGTLFGGTLQAIAKYSERVYSIDIDPAVPERLDGLFPNVKYLTGRSDELLPRLIDDLQSSAAPLTFALVDGDHSAEAVRDDINHLLRFRPEPG